MCSRWILYSVATETSKWLVRYYYRCLGPITVLSFAKGLCVLWKTSQFLGSLKLCLCLFFPVCTGPQVYPELRHWGPLRSFLGMYAALLMAGLLDLQEYVRAFQSPLWICCFSALPCKLLARLLFALTGITVSSSYSDKQLIFINFFFWQMPWE